MDDVRASLFRMREERNEEEREFCVKFQVGACRLLRKEGFRVYYLCWSSRVFDTIQ